MSSDFLISFFIYQQILHFKLERRFLFGKVALNGGFYTTPSSSEHMFLLYPTSVVVIEPVSSLSVVSNLVFSSNTPYSLTPMSSLFPFFSSLPIYSHHLFYFIVCFCVYSFATESFVFIILLLPSAGRHQFSKSVVK